MNRIDHSDTSTSRKTPYGCIPKADRPAPRSIITILADIPWYGTTGGWTSEAPILRLALYGHMSVHDSAGRSLLPRARKTRALLAILALASPRPVLRSQLTILLWSQREKEQARASLRQSVHELQETLGSDCGRLLCAERNHIALLARGLWVDALDLGRDPGTADSLLDLFRAPLLEDLGGLDPAFDRWLETERHRLVQIARTIAEGMLAECTTAAETMRAAERLLVIDRAHEGAWHTIIRSHAERGDRGAALAAFEQCRAALAQTAHLSPGKEILELVVGVRNQSIGIAALTAPAARAAPAALPRPHIRSTTSGIRLGIIPLRSLDPGGENQLAVGLGDEILTGLSRFRGISCVRISALSLQAAEASCDATPWDHLNLDFLVEGTVQRSSHHVRVMARLIDVWAAGEVIWAHRFDREDVDVLTLQDEIASEIVAQIDPRILLRQGERAASLQLENPTPHDLVLQAIPAIYRLERSGFYHAGARLDAAVSEDPGNAAAHAWYAYWHLFLVGQGWAEDPEAASNRASELARRAVTLDSGDARSLTLAGHVRGFLGRHAEEASTLHSRAIALNPNLALAWCFSGLAQCYRGNHDEALRLIRQAMRLSPYDPHLFFFDMALTMPHLLRGEYEAVVEIGRRAIELNPGFTSSYKGHLAALGHLGRRGEAEQIRNTLLALEPGFTVRQAITRSPIARPEDLARYADGLRRAGLPE
ncbi:MAG: BTAD domain-containing putative transcriptional regulator [Acetobacteraceae bacterium]|nr:BTAD domain-containing putative transcriptional regulator [Acetobacteraceae bacterium]